MSKIEELISEAELLKMIEELSDLVMERFGEDRQAVALVGIQRRGATLAKRMKDHMDKKYDCNIDIGTLDITLYRDDLSTLGAQPNVRGSQIPFDVDNRIIVLIDDVLYTGRTVRSALNAVVDHGRPRRLILLVIVDRGHRELPIQADITGKTIETTGNQVVHVHFKENDGEDRVLLLTKD